MTKTIVYQLISSDEDGRSTCDGMYSTREKAERKQAAQEERYGFMWRFTIREHELDRYEDE